MEQIWNPCFFEKNVTASKQREDFNFHYSHYPFSAFGSHRINPYSTANPAQPPIFPDYDILFFYLLRISIIIKLIKN